MGVYGYDQPSGGQPWEQSQQVIVAPGQQTMGKEVPRPPTDWTIPAILACICCFWPTGIFAIVFANKANTAYGHHDYDGAKFSAQSANVLTLMSIGIGVAIAVAIIILVVVIVTRVEEAVDDFVDSLNDLDLTTSSTTTTTRSPWEIK